MPIYTKRVIFIPKGSTKHIITYLSKKYPVNYLDYLLLKSFGYPQSGWIDLKQTKMTKFVFLKKLTYSKAAMINMQLTPGETYYFFLKDLAKKLKISEKKLFFYYEKFKFKKDGNIISQTYKPLAIVTVSGAAVSAIPVVSTGGTVDPPNFTVTSSVSAGLPLATSNVILISLLGRLPGAV